MISFESKGDFKKTTNFLNKVSRGEIFAALNKFGQEGVNALASATPVDSGLTANSWDYIIKSSKSSSQIVWTNSNVVSGVPVVIMLVYGHGTGTGGYVVGQNFINPAIQPIFDRIADDVWKAVTSA